MFQIFGLKNLITIINNHLSSFDVSKLKISDEEYDEIEGRFIIAKKLKPVPIESIVRNYLIGSGIQIILQQEKYVVLIFQKILKWLLNFQI